MVQVVAPTRVQARFTFPALVRRQTNPLVYVLLWGPFIAAYQIVNRFPLREPIILDFSWADRSVPFVPEFLPLYVAYLPLYWWTVCRSENDREVNRIFYAAHLQLLISLPLFVFYPVAMPRDLYYGSEVFGWADAFWRWFDPPNNCFPSLHTSNCLLLIQFNWWRRYNWLLAALLSGVIASTVLVKQHYMIDLVGGAAVYLVSRWFLRNLQIRGLTPDGWIASGARARD